MSASQPALVKTGHPEIDREHAVLLGLLKKLNYVCPLDGRTGCRSCPTRQRRSCETSLVVVMGGVLGFTVDHFAFEEKVMQAMPGHPGAAAHMDAHIRDHDRITRDLRELALSIGYRDVFQSAIEMQAVVQSWLGRHILDFDVPFVEFSGRGLR